MHRLLCGFLWFALVSGLSSATVGAVLDGVRAYEAGNFAAAIEAWLPGAAQDNPDALFNLGQVYRLGKGVRPDRERAESYYERAARLGHIAAQGNLGSLYFFVDDAAARDIAKALYWWQKAAEGGDSRSQYLLGIMYFNGDHLSRDYVTAYAWLSLAIAGGVAPAVEAEPEMRGYLSAREIESARMVAKTLLPTSSANRLGVLGWRASTPEWMASGSKPAAESIPESQQRQSRDTPEPTQVRADRSISASLVARYRVQLAALGSAAAANALWADLSLRFPDLLAGQESIIEKVDLGPEKEQIYRLRAGGFTERKSASALCDVLQRSDVACFVALENIN